MEIDSQQNISPIAVEPIPSETTSQLNKTCPVCKHIFNDIQNTMIAFCGCKFHTKHWEEW